jgi:hypothetical protein
MVSVGFKEILYDKCGQRAVEVAPPAINMTAVIQNWVHKTPPRIFSLPSIVRRTKKAFQDSLLDFLDRETPTDFAGKTAGACQPCHAPASTGRRADIP